MKKKLTTIFFLLITVTGCMRSDAYRRDRDYYASDTEDSQQLADAENIPASELGQPKKKILILPFLNETPLGGAKLGDFAAKELSRLLKASGRVVNPDLKPNSSSKDFYTGNKVKLGLLAREGRKEGVGLVVVGKIKRITYRKKGDEVGLFRKQNSIASMDLEMRLFDVTVPKELLFDEKSAESTSSQIQLFNDGEQYDDPYGERRELVQSAIENGTKYFAVNILKVIERFNWQGRVVKVSPTNIYINAGKASGLNIGDILKVITPGDDIYDPISGNYMGKSNGQTKGTLEVTGYLGNDGATTVVHSGGNFNENDLVQLY